MQVRVVQQVLTPGLEHGKKANARPQMWPVGSEGEQSLGHGAKQESIEPTLILQTQVSEGLGNSEHHVAVRYGQQLLGLLGQPAIASRRLALGAVTITAGVESDHPMSAGVALLYPSAQGGGAAGAEVMKSFPLGSRDGVPQRLRKRSPYWRKTSATSSRGWLTFSDRPRPRSTAHKSPDRPEGWSLSGA
jgi:hypothetical protein